MITEDYVSFETAKLLKEKGFDVPVTSVWIGYFRLVGCSAAISIYSNAKNWNGTTGSLKDIYTSAPTLQMAMKWLREGKNCPIEILWHWDSDNQCEEWYFKHHVELREQPQVEYHDKYEKACEEAIKYCLENLI